MTANLITDVAGVRVGSADDEARLRRDRRRVRRARGRLDRDSRRRAGGARHRAARAGHDGRAGRRLRPFGRLGLRPRRGGRRDGVAACGRGFPVRGRGCRLCRARSCSTSSTAATRPGADAALLGARLCAAEAAGAVCASGPSARALARRLRPQGRPRLGERDDRAGLSRRRPRGRQRGRPRDARREPPFLGGAVTSATASSAASATAPGSGRRLPPPP